VRKNKGFTLIELMIVVAVVGILAAVAIPKYGELIEKANLGATLGNLSSIRSAVSIYYGSHMEYPYSIDPHAAPGFAKVMGKELPYVKAVYPNHASPRGNTVTVSDVHEEEPTDAGKGWFFNRTDGRVYINSTEADIKGNAYSSY